jgi:hypothetical protein
VENGPFTIRVHDHDTPSVWQGTTTFSSRPLPYRKPWGHRYEVTIDACADLGTFIARVGPGNQWADYRAGEARIEIGERYYVDILDRTPTKDPVPTASEMRAAILDALAPHGVTDISFE